MLSAHQLPYFNLELMREESAERQQSVRNTPGKETLAGAYTTPEKKPKVLCAHGLLLHWIFQRRVFLRGILQRWIFQCR